MKLEGRGDASPAAYRQTLTAALLAYWHQLASFQNPANQTQAYEEGLQLAKPLWVLLGLSVIGGKNKSDQEQTSDVVGVLRFLFAILHGPGHLTANLKNALDVPVDGADLGRVRGSGVNNDNWIQGMRYMTLEAMAEVGGTPEPPPPALTLPGVFPHQRQ